MKKLILAAAIALMLPMAHAQQPAPTPTPAQQKVLDDSKALLMEYNQELDRLHGTVFSKDVDHLMSLRDQIDQVKARYAQAATTPPPAPVKSATPPPAPVKP